MLLVLLGECEMETIDNYTMTITSVVVLVNRITPRKRLPYGDVR